MSFFLSSCVLILLTVGQAWAQLKLNKNTQKTHREITSTMGQVPQFIKNLPQEILPTAWDDLKNIELNPDTTLSVKYKELIAAAVTSYHACSHCLYFHKKMSELKGASQQELKEALAIGAMTVRWSSYYNGMQIEEEKFRKDVSKILKPRKNTLQKEAMEEKPAALAVEKPNHVYQDIEATFGFVPAFLQGVPKNRIASAWKEIKEFELSSVTELPQKYKQLIGLAVASQIPCKYSVYYHTQKAIALGAEKEEIEEALSMAGSSANWSMLIKGQEIDSRIFREEVNQVINFIRNKAVKTVTVKDVYSSESL